MSRYYLVIFLEGFIVLATELLLIRQLIPFVGSGTEVISIVISSVLLPLAFGYEYGGRFDGRVKYKLINKLISNLLIALWFLVFALSYLLQEMFFNMLMGIGIKNNVIQAAIFCSLFIVYPVFLLGQTVPLISNFFHKDRLSSITGKILFFSTAGSFIGSVFTTLVLMMIIGVSNTVILVLSVVVSVIIILQKKLFSIEVSLACLALFIGVWLCVKSEKEFNIVSNNAYNQITISEGEDYTDFCVNRSYSSRLTNDPNKEFEYVKFIEKNLLSNIGENKEILIIGAGGFTIGKDDDKNHYTYLDIDPDMLKVSEKYFHKKPLGKNKDFIAMSARSYLNQSNMKFDFILIDVYTHVLSLPIECTTKEFYESVKKILKPKGAVIANIGVSHDFEDKYSIRINNTFASVFWPFNREVVRLKSGKASGNMIYTYYDLEGEVDKSIYTDNKNTYSIDRKI